MAGQKQTATCCLSKSDTRMSCAPNVLTLSSPCMVADTCEKTGALAIPCILISGREVLTKALLTRYKATHMIREGMIIRGRKAEVTTRTPARPKVI